MNLNHRTLVYITVLSTVTAASGSVLAAPKTIKWLACKNAVQMQAFQKIFNEYEKGRKVKIEPTVTDWGSMQSKTLLSVAAGRFNEFYSMGTDFAWMAQAKAIVPMDSYIKSSKFPIARQAKSAVKAFTYKGQIWGIPYGFYPVVLYYNKQLFDAAGVQYPTTNWGDKRWDWDAFLNVAKKLTRTDNSGRQLQSGVGTMQWHYFYPWYFGGDWSDEKLTKSTMNDPKTIRGLQEVADLTLKYKVAGKDFFAGKAAMMVDGAWSVAEISKRIKFQWNLAASPMGTDHSVPAFVDAFAMGYSKNRPETWDFVKWLSMDKNNLMKWLEADSGGGAVPTDTSLQARYLETNKRNHPGINFQVCIDAIDYATPVYLRYSKNWPKIDSIISPAVNDIMSGKKQARDVMNQLHPQIDKLIRTGGTR